MPMFEGSEAPISYRQIGAEPDIGNADRATEKEER